LVARNETSIDHVPRHVGHHEVRVLVSQRVGECGSEIVRTGLTCLSGDVSENCECLGDLDSINFEHRKSVEGSGWKKELYLLQLHPNVFQRHSSNCEHHSNALAT
ncbi:hypothetical protein PENTCL1PPCAC_15189, partial [Pristionchus entomophagus]